MARTTRTGSFAADSKSAVAQPAQMVISELLLPQARPDLAEQFVQVLRLDGDEQHVALGDDLEVPLRRADAEFLEEPPPRFGHVGGRQRRRRKEFRRQHAARDRLRHLPGADESESLVAHDFVLRQDQNHSPGLTGTHETFTATAMNIVPILLLVSCVSVVKIAVRSTSPGTARVPTRTRSAPSSTATSKSCVMPIESSAARSPARPARSGRAAR